MHRPIVVQHRSFAPGRLTLRQRLGVALAGVLALAVLVALLVVSFLIAIPLVAIFLVIAGRFLWRLRAEVRRARGEA